MSRQKNSRKISSNLVHAGVNAWSPDTNYNIYETKVDKLAARVNELEINLKSFISTTIGIHKTSHNLKQSILESEENHKHALQLIYNK